MARWALSLIHADDSAPGVKPGKHYVGDKGAFQVISVVNVLIKGRFDKGFRLKVTVRSASEVE